MVKVRMHQREQQDWKQQVHPVSHPCLLHISTSRHHHTFSPTAASQYALMLEQILEVEQLCIMQKSSI